MQQTWEQKISSPQSRTDSKQQSDGEISTKVLDALDEPVCLLGDDGELGFANHAFRVSPLAANVEHLRGLIANQGPQFTRNLRLAEQNYTLEATVTPDGYVLLFHNVRDGVNGTSGASTSGHDEWAGDLAHHVGTAALLFIELDRFSGIHDTMGKAVSDKLMSLAADRVRSAVGEGGRIQRIDQRLAVLHHGIPQPEASAALAERLLDLLGRAYILDGKLLNTGVSIGLASVLSSKDTMAELVRRAGLALRLMRTAGRAGYALFQPQMDEQLDERLKLENDLRRSLALRELKLCYQPQLNLSSGKVTGFEALLRWHHPERGVVSPAEFIPLAEEIGLIVPMGEWVIRTACREAASWDEPLKVAINVSSVQFTSPGLLPCIVSALASSGLDPHRLEIEITESVMLGDKDAALQTLHALKNMGVQVAMDDFGTGYSSLSYLRSFPFDKIKIDQSFVRGNADVSGGMAIVHAIAAIGSSLGMKTIAEGVETEAQLAQVASDGCTDAQGYLISRPLPPEQISAFLKFYQEQRSTTSSTAET